MHRRVPALLLFVLAGQVALAQSDTREPGTRPERTRAERERFELGEVQQPPLPRPDGFASLSEAEARARLREVLEANPERTLEELRPGLENVRAVQERLRRLAERHPDLIRVTRLGTTAGFEVLRFDVVGSDPGQPRVLVTGGVHAGSEVVGVESAVRLLEVAARDPALRGKVQLTVIPLVTPTALVLGTRRNHTGGDVNRSFRDGEWTAESRMLREILRVERFDASLDLHGAGIAGRDGFFVIRNSEDHGLIERASQALPKTVLLEEREPGSRRHGSYELTRLGVASSSNAGTLKAYLAERGTPYSYTFEAPTRIDAERQVRGLVRLLRATISHFPAHLARYPGARIAPGVEPPATERAEPVETTRTESRQAEALPPVSEDVLVEAKRLDRFRRVDGTLDWARVREPAAREAAGVAKFGMALFLVELARVAQTGDRARIEEFFEGLLSVGFYQEYGLFMLGARAGDVAYGRYLQRFVRPNFVSSILRSNVTLAIGMALPQLVSGHFSGPAFVISLASLGLSSTAVQTGVRGIQWVATLQPRAAASLRGLLPAAGRAGRIGGWVYTAVELAVVLYVAEEIGQAITERIDRAEAVERLADAEERFLAAIGRPDATAADAAAAIEDLRASWESYRAFLERPLDLADERLAQRLARVAREAKLGDDEREALLRVGEQPSLRLALERRYGSLEAYADHHLRVREAALSQKVDAILSAYAAERESLILEVVAGSPRARTRLGDVPNLSQLLAGKKAPRDPFFGQFLPGLRRANAWRALRKALERPATARLQTYDDEAELLAASASALADRPSLVEALAAAEAEVLELRAATAALVEGAGLAEQLERATRGD